MTLGQDPPIITVDGSDTEDDVEEAMIRQVMAESLLSTNVIDVDTESKDATERYLAKQLTICNA